MTTRLEHLEHDVLAFQSEVEALLRGLHMRQEAPAAAERAGGIQFACLGPIALVFAGFVALFLIAPTAQRLANQGLGLVVVVLLPLGLLLLARWLGKLNRQQQQSQVGQYREMLDDLIRLEPDNPTWPSEQEALRQQTRLSVAEQDRLRNAWEQVCARHAAELLATAPVRECICPVLHPGTGDIFAIGRRISGALHSGVQQGQVQVPLIPLLVAQMAMEIERRGVAQVCAPTPRDALPPAA